ncbi:hypothetical protein GOBAR_AA09911 [Gossypium barbadense]|uniref:Uncharacterized protein n=1 Tax=Gossypium barbadense TaxID=3634 RepID=A0A2P5Y573_GOSBA|nr:hypothetical protein GOBAR_AA09911 [Gossypium barbadense]
MHQNQGKNLHKPCLSNIKGPIYEERRLQIEELDEWWTQKSRTPDKPKLNQDELTDSPNQLKVGDKVLLDAVDPRIATSEPNGVIPLTVLNIFPYGTIEIIHPKFVTFKGKSFSLTRDAISFHGCATWPWAKLPKQLGRETRSCLETVVETENLTRVCDMPVSFTRGRHCQKEHERGLSYTGCAIQLCAPTCPRNTSVGQMSDAPKFKNHEMYRLN